MIKTIITTLSLLLLLISSTPAQETKATFEKANTHFLEANQAALTDPTKAKELYEKAILKYQFLLDQNNADTPAIHLNLANAYFQTGQNGRAVLHYQRTIILDPTNKEATHNLNYLRSLIVDELPPTHIQSIRKTLTFWHRWPFPLRLSIFTIANITLFSLLAYLFFRKSKLAYSAIAISCTTALITGISLLATVNRWDNPIDGVIVQREIIARQGDGMIYANAFDSPLHTGTEFKILEKRASWLYVQLINSQTCWLPESAVELIRY